MARRVGIIIFSCEGSGGRVRGLREGPRVQKGGATQNFLSFFLSSCPKGLIIRVSHSICGMEGGRGVCRHDCDFLSIPSAIR